MSAATLSDVLARLKARIARRFGPDAPETPP